MIPIPLVDENDFILEAPLEERTYFLHFSWNSEGRFWVMGVNNANSDTVLQGIVLVPNVALLATYRTYELPPGEFVAYAENPLEQLDRDSFITGRATLYYLTEAEYAAL